MHIHEMSRERPRITFSDSVCVLETSPDDVLSKETAVKEIFVEEETENCITCKEIVEKNHFQNFGTKQLEPKLSLLKRNGSSVLLDRKDFDQANAIFDDLLRNDRDVALRNNVTHLPEIEVKVFSLDTPALADSGSTSSAISHELWDQIKERQPPPAFLKASNLKVTSAFGRKIASVIGQTLLELSINGQQYDTLGLIIQGLNRPLILGSQFFYETAAMLDYGKCTLTLQKPVRVESSFREVEIKDSDLMFRNLEVTQVFPTFLDDGQDDVYSLHETDLAFKPNAECFMVRESPQVGTHQGEMAGLKYPSPSELTQKVLSVAEWSKVTTQASKKDIMEHVASYRNLTDSQRTQLTELLLKHQSIFDEKPGCIVNYEHQIDVIDSKPIHSKMYPFAHYYQNQVRNEVNRWLSWGIIRKNATAYSNPLVVIPKRNNKIRVCLDGRLLARVSLGETDQPIPPVDVLVELSDKKVFASFDIVEFFLQVKVRESDQKYLGFVFEGISYTFVRLPFGTKTSLSSCIRALDTVLGEEVNSFCRSYVDDLCVASRDFLEHLQHLDTVFTKLKQGGITLRLKKSVFAQESIKLLGYELSSKGLGKDKDKFTKIIDFRTPKTVKETRQLLGFINFYRIFSNKYSEVLFPIYQLLKKNVKFRWLPIHSQALEKVREIFQEEVVLKKPLPDREFILEVDASDRTCSSIIYQVDADGQDRIIGMHSKVFSSAQMSYSITEKEMYALIEGVAKYKHYLVGRKFIVRSDHLALKFILHCRLTNQRIARWAITLANLDFEFQFVRSKENKADFHSRYPPHVDTHIDIDSKPVVRETLMSLLEDVPCELRNLIAILPELQSSDGYYGPLKRALEKGDSMAQLKSTNHEYVLLSGKLCKKVRDGARICIPEAMVKPLLSYHHDECGHLSASKLLPQLSEMYVWKRFRHTIRKFCASCTICQKATPPHQYLRGPLNPILVDKPGKCIAADFCGPLVKGIGGVVYILAFVDLHSKLVGLYACRKATTNTALQKLREYLKLCPNAETILTDRGSQFTSATWKTETAALGLRHVMSTAYYPQGEPAETIVKSTARMLRKYCYSNQKSWPRHLAKVERCLNSAIHLSTGRSAYEVHLGISSTNEVARLFDIPEMERPRDIKYFVEQASHNLKKTAAARKKYFDAHHKTVIYEVGDLVLARIFPKSDALAGISKKLMFMYSGPWVIVSKTQKNVYTLGDPLTKVPVLKRNAYLIKRYKHREEASVDLRSD